MGSTSRSRRAASSATRPNGAGKTTTVRILVILLRPDAGHATVAGFDVVRQAQQIRSVIGLSGQYAAVENLTGRENLTMFGQLYQLPAEARRRADELLEQFALGDAAGIGRWSRPTRGGCAACSTSAAR